VKAVRSLAKSYFIPVRPSMSKSFRYFSYVFAASVLILQLFNNSNAQEFEATIKIDSANFPSARVEGRFVTGGKARNLSFLMSFSGIDGLGERVSEVNLADNRGNAVSYRKFVAGEYVADADFTSWSYRLDLTPPKNRTAAAHVSWLTSENGLLMLGDVLPIFGKDAKATVAKVTIVLPDGWRQMENRIDGTVETKDVQSEVVAIGKDIRFRTVHIDGTAITICIDGEWLFNGDDVISVAQENYSNLKGIFGADVSNRLFINIFRFPQETSVGQWQADTRGRNITIISSDMPFKSQSIQRLHEQLRHEIFHLWIPNGVNLSGDYDWFYEGFALYESLKLGVSVNRLRFDDFLDTLSRAYDIDAMQSRKTSLIDASKNRWNGSNTQVYARGMLVAFLCDLALLDKSKGKRSVADLLRTIYDKHRPPSPERDGNAVVLALLRSNSELIPIVDRYIEGNANLDWNALIKAAGLETESKDQLTKLKVATKPNGRQKDLLNKLGYNNWRKLAVRR